MEDYRDWVMLKYLRERDKLRMFGFICAWFAFNGMYTKKFGLKLSDSKKINKVKVDPDFLKTHMKLLRDKSYKEAIDVLAQKGVRDLRFNTVVSINNRKNFAEVLDAVYTVRNNLFHGMKRPNNSRDILLAEKSQLIIERLMRDLDE